ncbi:gliding motility-associated C-terminal domain-containing protein [Hymenobacter citatus]|nr:gliding motility-associated C-terminal domain-containing protein [Hymenobacter citatus]
MAAALAAAPTKILDFIENRGQWDTRARYAANLHQGRLFLEPDGLTYALFARNPLAHAHDDEAAPTAQRPTLAPTAAADQLAAHALRVRFAGASPQVQLRGEEVTGEVRNYMHGADPTHWASKVPSFRQVRYQQLWPGIDVHFYENAQQQLEYDFEVAPRADATVIQLRYEGADALRLRADGALLIQTSVGTLTELAPQAWQLDAAGQRQPVTCAYEVHNYTVTLRVGTYDHQRPLTIDPTVVFASFTGSTSDNWGFTATYDAQGNLYSGGIAFGPGYPTTTGAYNTTVGNVVDIALIKYNPAANGPAARVWATYLGGAKTEYPHSLVVNNLGELVMLGTTSSTDFPTTVGAYSRHFNGGTYVEPYSSSGALALPNGSDLVVTRFSADGTRLLGSTFLGGSGNDGILNPKETGLKLFHNYGDAFRGDILVDDANDIYLASYTGSPDFPIVNGFTRTYQGGTTDALVCKLNAGLTSLLWSSFLGGSEADAAYSLQLGARNDLYVCGGTTSPTLPATAGSLLPNAPGNIDAFVARISADGTTLNRTTYLGTASYDQAYFLQLDADGGVYTLGQSLGNYPVTAGRYTNPGSHQFIHKLNADLTNTEFSTVFGSGRPALDISPTAFLVDQCDRIYVSGYGGGAYISGSSTFGLPITANALQPTTDGRDFYLLQLSAGATKLEYATFYGGYNSSGEHVDGGTSRFDKRGVVYQAVCGGCGGSSNLPIPPGATTFSATNNSTNCNNFAFKFDFQPTAISAGPDATVCLSATSYRLTGHPAGGTWSGPGVVGSAAEGYRFVPTPALVGQNTLRYVVEGKGLCGGESSLQLTVTPGATVSFSPLPQSTYCLDYSYNGPPVGVPLTATPAGGTFSGPGVRDNKFFPASAGPGTHRLVYTAADSCRTQASQSVTVTAPPYIDAGYNATLCSDGVPVRLGGYPSGGTWTGPGVTGSESTGFFFTPTPQLVGSQVLTYTIQPASGCSASRQITLSVQATPSFSFPAFPAYCTTMPDVSLPQGATWYGPGVVYSYTISRYIFTPSFAGAGQHKIFYRVVGSFCESAVELTVLAPPTPRTDPDTVLCPGTTQPFRLRATPTGGTWSGTGVTADGLFTPPAGFTGSAVLTYTATNAACTSTTTRTIRVATPPTAQPSWQAQYCPENQEAPLRISFIGATPNATWDFGDGTQATGSATEHVYTTAGRYQPTVVLPYNNSLCRLPLTLPVVEVLPAFTPPNIFTPNHDRINDFFEVTTSCPPQLQIFSRWGAKVYESVAYHNDWDGGTQPDGIYYYLLRLIDGRTVKGWVEIRR